MIANSIAHLQQALSDLDREVERILGDMSLSLNQKDNLMLALLLQKRILKEALEALEDLKRNPPKPNQPCGISRYREDS